MQRVPAHPSSSFILVNIFRYLVTFVTTAEPPLLYYRQPNSRLYLDFTTLSTDALFVFQDPIQDTTLHLVLLPPSFLLGCEFLSLCLFFITLTVLRSVARVYCKMFLSLGLSDIFLMVGMELCLLRNTKEVKFISNQRYMIT